MRLFRKSTKFPASDVTVEKTITIMGTAHFLVRHNVDGKYYITWMSSDGSYTVRDDMGCRNLYHALYQFKKYLGMDQPRPEFDPEVISRFCQMYHVVDGYRVIVSFEPKIDSNKWVGIVSNVPQWGWTKVKTAELIDDLLGHYFYISPESEFKFVKIK